MSREMKDSGIEWIGKIPSDWNIQKVKYVAELAPKCHTEHLNNESEVTFSPMECIKNGYFINRSAKFSSKNSSYNQFQNEDIVIAKVTPCFENGNIAIMKELYNDYGFGSSELFVLRCNNTIYNKYLFYYLQNALFINMGISNMTGTGGLKRVSSDFIKNNILALPTLKEQQKIVDYLDKKVSEIDNIVNQTTLSIKEYKKYKQSIITEIVTRGLDPDVEMKNSGVDWIGKININWGIYPLKKLGVIKGRIGFKGYTTNDLVDKDTEGCAIVLGGTNIMKDGYISYEKLTYLSEYKYLESPEIMLKGNEILITKVGAGLGESALYEHFTERVTINPNVMIFISNDTEDAKFINYYLQSNYIKEDMLLEGNKSGAQPAINQSYVKNIKIVFPNDKKIQQGITDYLDEKCFQIDNFITQKQQLLTELESYKKSLIYECVTGKREVK